MTAASFDSLFGNSGDGDVKEPTLHRRGRKPRSVTGNVVSITKAQIVDVINLANLAVAVSPYTIYQLQASEVSALADAWHKIILEHPGVAKYLIVGKSLGVWGNIFMVHYQIISARVDLFNAQQNQARATRTHSGTERHGENDARTGATILT